MTPIIGTTGRRIVIATIATAGYSTDHAYMLSESARRWGVQLLVTESTLKWRDFFWNKIIAFQRELRRIAGEYDTLIYLDAGDTIIVRDPREADATFASTGAGVLAGAEVNCWPWRSFAGQIKSPHAQKFINAGAWMADAGSVDALFEALIDASIDLSNHPAENGQTSVNDDQVCWNELNRQRHPLITLDWQSRVFLNVTCESAGGVIFGTPIKSVFGDGLPVFVHGPTPKNSLLQRAWNEFTQP